MSAARPSTTEAIAATRVRWGWHVAVAATLYVAVTLYAFRPVLSQFTAALPYPTTIDRFGGNWQSLTLNDEMLTASVLTHNARRIMQPWRLGESWQCYPLANARALGEHMLGMGLRGALPYSLTRDPVATTNVVFLSLPWFAGMAMYALVAYWTRLPAAALIAGLLFALQPPRLINMVHPYVEANEWTVVALLGAHLLFAHGRWRDAALLGGAIVLQTLESFYPVLAFAVIGGAYGIYLVVRYHRRLPSLLPKIAAVVAAAAVVGALVFVPYIRMRALWGTAVGGRTTILYAPSEFGYRGQAWVGSVTAALMVVGLADRLRRRRDARGYDPRLPFLVAGTLVVWLAVGSVSLPFGIELPSLYTLASSVVPGLDSIRGGGAIGRGGVPIVATFLAGYGALVVLERLGGVGRAVATTAIVTAALVDVFLPAQAQRDFGTQVTMAANHVQPKPELVALYDRLPQAPVLDVPFDYSAAGILTYMPHYVFLAAYHERPIGGCYNSFVVRVQEDIGTLASRLPEASAADALAALGFRSVMVHDELIMRRLARLEPLTGFAFARHPLDPAVTHLTPLGGAANHTAYLLDHAVATTESDAALAVDAADVALAPNGVPARAPQADVIFTFHNNAAEVYRHPPPIAPTELLVRWYSRSGELVRDDQVRDMLPLALPPGQTLLRKITVPVAIDPGVYDITLSRASAPGVVLSRQRLNVAPPAS